LLSVSSAGDAKRFSEKDLVVQQRRVLNTLFNVFKFYETYVKNSYVISIDDSRIKNDYIKFSVLDQ
jgi:hypothetical protein